MRCPAFLPQIVLLLGLVLGALSAQDAKAPSVTGKWLAEQDPQWQTAYRDVTGAYQKALADLKKQYAANLEMQLAGAARAGKLDDALAFRSERDRVTSGDVPADNDPAALASLRALRAGFAKNFAALMTDHGSRAKALYTRYDAVLAQNQAALTQRQRLDEALEIKAWRERVKAEWLDGNPLLASLSPTPTGLPSAATPAKSTPSPAATPASTPAFAAVTSNQRIDVYFCGSNGMTLYVNTREILAGVRREKVQKTNVTLHEGDTVFIRSKDRFDINNEWACFVNSNGQFLFETSDKWTSYLPADEDKWWSLNKVKAQKPAIYAPDRQEYVNVVQKSVSETDLKREARPIRSELKGANGSYVFYKVTRADLVPKTEAAPPAK